MSRIKRAIDISRYVILVTDVPVDQEKHRLRKALLEQIEERRRSVVSARSRASAVSRPAASAAAARLDDGSLSDHNGTAPPAKAGSVVERWVPEPGSPPNGATTLPLASASPAARSNGRRGGGAVAEGLERAAPPDGGAGERTTNALSGELRVWLSEHCAAQRGVTDLRRAEARERLAARLCSSAEASTPVLEGEAGLRAWRSLTANVTVPAELANQLCAWVDSRGASAVPSRGASDARCVDPAASQGSSPRSQGEPSDERAPLVGLAGAAFTQRGSAPPGAVAEGLDRRSQKQVTREGMNVSVASHITARADNGNSERRTLQSRQRQQQPQGNEREVQKKVEVRNWFDEDEDGDGRCGWPILRTAAVELGVPSVTCALPSCMGGLRCRSVLASHNQELCSCVACCCTSGVMHVLEFASCPIALLDSAMTPGFLILGCLRTVSE